LLLFFSFSLSALEPDGNLSQSAKQSSELSAPQSPEKKSASQMTDAEIVAELMTALTKREARIVERENELAKKEANWTERNNLLNLRKSILDESENYWKNYKSDTLKDKLLIAVVSFAGGYVLREVKE
jgi:hypothetical protein